MDHINGHNMYKTKLVIPSSQTDILRQHKLFLCGYAVLNRSKNRKSRHVNCSSNSLCMLLNS